MPCRAETPSLKQAYSKYSSKKFDILNVSLDHNRDLWLKAFKDDQLLWHQVSDLKGWQNEVSSYIYKIKSIPANFLIDPTGKIIAKNLRGKELLKKLEELKL